MAEGLDSVDLEIEGSAESRDVESSILYNTIVRYNRGIQ